VSQPHTLVAWLDTRSSDVTDTCPPPCPLLPAKLTASRLTVSSAVDPHIRSVFLQRSGHIDVSQPLVVNSAAELSPSHLVTRPKIGSGLAVATN
jgi:hypothetical protein